MGAYTPRAGLYKPGGGSTGLILPDETVDIDQLNSNSDIIDNLLGARNIPSASGYAGTFDGDLVYAQDDEILRMYSAAAGQLVYPRALGGTRFVGTTAERNAFTAMKENDSWFDTDLDFEFIYQGSQWRANRSGEVLLTASSEAQTIPNGGWGTIAGLNGTRKMYAGEWAHIQVMGEVHNAGSGAAQQFGIRVLVNGAAVTPTRANYYLASTPGGNSYAIGVAIQVMYLSSTEANRNFVVQGIRSSAGAVGATLNFTVKCARKQYIS